MKSVLRTPTFVGLMVLANTTAQTVLGSVDIASRDAGYSHGTIKHHLRYRSSKGLTFESSTELAFADDGRMAEHIDKPGNMPGVESATFVKTKGCKYSLITLKGVKTASFWNLQDLWARNENANQFIVERPCAPLGLGLSKRKLTSVTPSGVGQLLNFESGQRSRITVKVDSDGNPLESKLSLGDDASVAFAFQGVVPTGTGLSLPASAVAHCVLPGENLDYTYQILSANLTANPPDSELEVSWFRPDVDVIDYRVDPAASWTYERLKKANGGKETLTPEELLQLSKGLSAYIAREIEAKHRKTLEVKSKAGMQGWTVAAVFAAIPVLIAAVWRLVWHRRQKQGPKDEA